MPAFNNQEVTAKPEANAAFFTVAPGVYPAVVRNIEDRPSYWGPFPNGASNPKHAEGHWEWVKVVPTIELLNDAHTVINKQDMTLGVFDAGVPVAPNPKSDPIFSGWYRGKLGAGTLLRALGLMVRGEGNQAILRGDTNSIHDAVVNVRTAVGLYSGDKKNFGPDETLALLKEQNGGVVPTAFSQYREILTAYNTAHELEGETALKMKNFIVDIQPLSDAEVAAGGYTRDAFGTVYLTQASAKAATTSAVNAAPGSIAGW